NDNRGFNRIWSGREKSMTSAPQAYPKIRNALAFLSIAVAIGFAAHYLFTWDLRAGLKKTAERLQASKRGSPVAFVGEAWFQTSVVAVVPVAFGICVTAVLVSGLFIVRNVYRLQKHRHAAPVEFPHSRMRVNSRDSWFLLLNHELTRIARMKKTGQR